MQVMVNGEYRSLPDRASVADLVGELPAPPRGVAVAVNGDVVPRSMWPAEQLRDGDSVEVLTAVQGG